MNLGTNLLGKFALFSISVFLVGCNDLKENDVNADDSKKLSVEFSQSEVSIPIGGSLDLLVNISPANRAGEVTFQVAEETVVSLDKQTPCEEGVMLHLSSHKLSSTTVYAFHEALAETPECVITVAPIGLESIALDKETLSLKVFESATLSAKLTPENVTNPVLIWKSDNEEVVTVDNGVVTAHKTGEALVTVSFDGKSASCKVVVTAIPAESVTLWFDKQQVTEKVISVNEKLLINATILPEDVTYKTISRWTVSAPDIIGVEPIVVEGNTISANIVGKSAGAADLVAEIDLGEGVEPIVAKCRIIVKPVVAPTDAPRIGDYFYSDGTWSYGGLVSINSDGTEAVWLTGKERPAPVEGKTVIGIVFQTDQSRISEAEKEKGYTHGLVMSLKRAYKPAELKDPNNKNEVPDSLTRFYVSESLERRIIPTGKSGTSYYGDIDGYTIDKNIREEYPGDEIAQFPALDWISRLLSAPASTSGWYVPASGQVWDLLANLGGNEIAEHLLILRTYDADVTYMKFATLTYNPIAELNSHWSLVPPSMKENMWPDRLGKDPDYFMLMTSTQYDAESLRVFWVSSKSDGKGGEGEFGPMCQWLNDVFPCYPVLSF